MIRRIEQPKPQNSKSELVRGTIQQINDRGIKVNDRWYNFSKFLKEKPEIAPNDNVVFLADQNFISKFIAVEKQPKQPAEAKPPETTTAETLLLEALRSAVSIASTLESEVSIKFSTQDIIKLALTLFIQKSSEI